MTEPHKPTTDYRPISCDRHSEYELAIMHHQRLHLRWVEGNVIHDEIVLPLDLRTINHEEFLICRAASGAETTIRLDRIRHKETL